MGTYYLLPSKIPPKNAILKDVPSADDPSRESYITSLRQLSICVHEKAAQYLQSDRCLQIFATSTSLKVSKKTTLQKGKVWINLQRFDMLHRYSINFLPLAESLQDTTCDNYSTTCNI